MLLHITAVHQGSSYFQVAGDLTTTFAAGDYIQVVKSTGNNGTYKLSAVNFATGYTRLVTVEAIPTSAVDGYVTGGVYDLKYTDGAATGKAPIVLTPTAVDVTTTSLGFNGKAALNYGERQQENVLRLLENFASGTAPSAPTSGQHWYDFTNDVTKTYTGTRWSSDVNVEQGVLTFKDNSHPTPNTKYIITANSSVSNTGVVLYPATNPSTGDSLFSVTTADQTDVFVVEHEGETRTSNTLNVTSTGTNEMSGRLRINTSLTHADGAIVNRDLVVTSGGHVYLDSGCALRVASGATVTLANNVTLRGATAAGGVLILTTGGVTTTSFSDTSVVFSVPTTMTTVTATTVSTGTLSVTGNTTLNTASVATLGVSGTSTLAIANVTTLAVSGTTTLAGATATSLGVTGTSTLNTANVTTLTVSGSSSLNTVSASSATVSGLGGFDSLSVTNGSSLNTLTVSGASTFNGAITAGTTLAVTGNTTLNTVTVSGLSSLSNVSVSGTITVQAPSAAGHATTKTYVDTAIGTCEPSITAGTSTQYWAGDKTWKDFPWDLLRTPTVTGGVLTLDLSVPCGFRINLNQDVTSIVFANVPTERAIAFAVEWVQDATGGHTITWPASVVTDDGTQPQQPDSAANSVTVHSFLTFDSATTVRMASASQTYEHIMLPVGSQTSSIPTGINVESIVLPYDFVVVEVQASLRVAQDTGAAVSVDVKVGGTSILSAPVTFVNTQRTTITNPTQPTVVTPAHARGTELTFDVTAAAAVATGLKITIVGYSL